MAEVYRVAEDLNWSWLGECDSLKRGAMYLVIAGCHVE